MILASVLPVPLQPGSLIGWFKVNVLSLTRHLRTIFRSTSRRQRYHAEQVFVSLRGQIADPEISRMIERIPTTIMAS